MSVPRTDRFYRTNTVIARKKKRKKKKFAKSKTWKGGLDKKKKGASRWIENSKGRSRQKLGAHKKDIYSRWIENSKEQSKQKLGIQNKKQKRMTAEACPWEKHSSTVCKWRLLPDFWLMGFIPKKCLFHHQLICVGPCPDVGLIHLQQCYPQWRLSSGCIAMSVHFPSYQPNLVSSSYYTVTPSYKYKFHTYIHTYIIHTFIHT
jgi:hypothetical protein